MEMNNQLEVPAALTFELENGWLTQPVETLWRRENPFLLSVLNKSVKAVKPKSGDF
jgi:hypothetical protein